MGEAIVFGTPSKINRIKEYEDNHKIEKYFGVHHERNQKKQKNKNKQNNQFENRMQKLQEIVQEPKYTTKEINKTPKKRNRTTKKRNRIKKRTSIDAIQDQMPDEWIGYFDEKGKWQFKKKEPEKPTYRLQDFMNTTTNNNGGFVQFPLPVEVEEELHLQMLPQIQKHKHRFEEFKPKPKINSKRIMPRRQYTRRTPIRKKRIKPNRMTKASVRTINNKQIKRIKTPEDSIDDDIDQQLLQYLLFEEAKKKKNRRRLEEMNEDEIIAQLIYSTTTNKDTMNEMRKEEEEEEYSVKEAPALPQVLDEEHERAVARGDLPEGFQQGDYSYHNLMLLENHVTKSGRGLTGDEFSKWVKWITFNGSPGEKECSICMDDFEDQHERPVALLSRCKHVFHMECIRKWFHEHKDCPICRMVYEKNH
mmetsp:Transcript_9237/g.13692  ORF Transcript_9237/g.13692 Transcript_9237/m.13692 type:complete len:419 (+) Transcript_9237:60-1316(+)